MRGYVPEFNMKTPQSLSQALEWMKADPKLKPFAGGTDLMVLLEAGKLEHHDFLNINGLGELKKITVSDPEIQIGSLVTYSEIIEHPVFQIEFPMLVQAAKMTGAIAIQNRGTIGGNIANASPAADTPPALMAYNAKYLLTSSKGERVVSSSEFHVGYKKTALDHEILHSITLKRQTKTLDHQKHYYQKVGTRQAQAISKVCLAIWAHFENSIFSDVRIGMGSVGPTSLRALKTEKILRSHKLSDSLVASALQELRQEVVPIDDIRSDSAYRLDVSCNLLEDFLNGLAHRS
jgi:CO/xanthine dehydrogenase FAD-binding subunit